MKKMEIIPKGSLLTISSGAYSDYTIQGVFRALQDIDGEKLREEWIAEHPEQANKYRFSESDFLANMAKLGLIEDVPCWDYHLGDYGCILKDEMYTMEYNK